MHWQHVAVANHIRPQVGSPDAASLLGSLELRSSVVAKLKTTKIAYQILVV